MCQKNLKTELSKSPEEFPVIQFLEALNEGITGKFLFHNDGNVKRAWASFFHSKAVFYHKVGIL